MPAAGFRFTRSLKVAGKSKLDLSFFGMLRWVAIKRMETSRVIQIAITDRSKKYGYVFWPRAQDDEMSALLGKRDTVDVVFMNAEHGEKKIDWQYRRISIGWRWIRSLPESKKVFVLKMSTPNKLEIQCR